MSSGGWVKLHRQLLKNPIFKNDKIFRVFIYLLLSAQHTEGDILVGDTIVHLKVGQWVTGRQVISRDTGLTEQNVRTALSKLEKLGILTIKPTTKFSIISITNWSKYQQDNQQPTNSQPTANQQLTTNNNVKKEKNDKNEKEISNLPAKADQKSDLDLSPFFSIGFTQSQVSEIWQIRKANKGKPIKTQRVINSLAKEFYEAAKGGMTIDGILNEWATRGWQSFKAEWVLKNSGQPQQKGNWDNTDALAGEFENMLNSGDINL